MTTAPHRTDAPTTRHRYYTMSEVAEAMRVHPKTLHRLRREGRIDGRQIGRRWYLDKQSVDAFMSNWSRD